MYLHAVRISSLKGRSPLQKLGSLAKSTQEAVPDPNLELRHSGSSAQITESTHANISIPIGIIPTFRVATFHSFT